MLGAVFKSRRWEKRIFCSSLRLSRSALPLGTSRRTPTASAVQSVIMGLTFTKLFQRLFSKKEMRILMVR